MSKTSLVIVTAAGALAAGVLAGGWLARRGISQPAGKAASRAARAAASVPAAPAGSTQPELEVSIFPEEVSRMNLQYAEVTEEAAVTEVRVPGTVRPDAYREVRVNALVGGIATKVAVELGQSVKREQVMAQIFSRELAEAQSEYLGMVAQLEAEHKKLQRTQELLGLGAASREEFETVEASHHVHEAHVEEARQKLLLLGLNDKQLEVIKAGRQISSDVPVTAPSGGVLTVRSVNPGQVVAAGQELFAITDLSSVWIEGSVLEDHLATARMGSRASITTPAYPGRIYSGVVTYIDPNVDPQTRTAKVRVVVENSGHLLRLGMFMDMVFRSSGARKPTVPAKAIQMMGSASVVFTPVDGQAGRFRQRIVRVGADVAGGRRVVDGVGPGEQVVTEGSFLLRAEALRQHPQ
jgi:RND family efflux transporter MFP subunit